MPILLHSQSIKKCDSAISVCPDVFDHLIKQDVLEQKYYTDYYHILTEKNILVFQLQQTDSLKHSISNILEITNQERINDKQQLDIVKKDLVTVKKTNTRIKIFAGITIVLEAIGIGWAISK